jgi:hypothetical protein
MAAQRVARGQFGVIEIVGWIVSHAKLVHDASCLRLLGTVKETKASSPMISNA